MEITTAFFSAGTYAVVVGAGATGVVTADCGSATPNGTDTSFDVTLIAKGGGGGGTYCTGGTSGNEGGKAGGSGGGASGGGGGTLTGGATNQGAPASGGINNMVLVSEDTEAEAAPTKGDLVMTYTTAGGGSTTVGTDLTAEVSADDGSTWTDMGLVAGDIQGTTGGHTIISKHNVTISSTITAPYKMRYRIKTLNQAAAKETRIQAVSLGWS